MRTRYLSLLAAIFLLLGGGGCVSLSSLRTSSTSTGSTQIVSSSTQRGFVWEHLGGGLDRVETTFSTTTGSVLILYRLSPKRFQATVRHALPPKHVSVWGAEATGTVLLVNGVYFHEDYLPSGFLEIKGERIGSRQFDQDKSGVIQFDPFRLIDTKTQPLKLGASPTMAQSYPFLVKNGTLAITEESGKVARRTFLGIDRDGFMYVGVAPYAPISLFQLGRFLTTLPIMWTSVLNLDGGPSTGLWMHQGTREELFDSYVPVPNVMVFRTLYPTP